jgi:polyhydroxyalkanoate synthesis regulator protein
MAAALILVKRYGRFRLYDTCQGRYVTLVDLHCWLRQGISFVVMDIETGEDSHAFCLP